MTVQPLTPGLSRPIAVAAPPLLTLSGLVDDELDLLRNLLRRVDVFGAVNREKEEFYEGSRRIRDLGISIPPHMRAVETVVGWPGTTVDVLEERLDLEGFISPGVDLGLSDVFGDNDLDVESGLAHLDALIYGVAFICVGAGGAGEPDPLITVESPTSMTAIYDPRARRVSAAVSRVNNENGQPVEATLYLPDETVRLAWRNGLWMVDDRDRHRLGRVPVARLVNRPRSGRMEGRSEITRAVRAYTEQAVRTLLGMEVNREFYSSPQRYILGASEEAFVDAEGKQKSAWETVMGRMLALDRDEEGNLPEVGTFTASSPAPYLDQVRGLAQLLAAEAAIPASYLGFHTENPSSADAIRQAEARLVKRAERRQRMFGLAWTEAARLALLVRDGDVPEGFGAVRPQWRDPSTPTRAAAADEATKLIATGVLTPDSEVTYDRIGLSETDKQRLIADKRRAGATQAVTALSAAAAAARTDPVVAAFAGRRGDADAG